MGLHSVKTPENGDLPIECAQSAMFCGIGRKFVDDQRQIYCCLRCQRHWWSIDGDAARGAALVGRQLRLDQLMQISSVTAVMQKDVLGTRQRFQPNLQGLGESIDGGRPPRSQRHNGRNYGQDILKAMCRL